MMASKTLRRAALAVVFWRSAGATAAPKCLDGDGKAVDYWYIFKHPSGYSYSYGDRSSTSLSKGGDDLNSDESPLGRTLLQVYKQSGLAYAMWNDETPGGGKSVPSSYAHAKGVLAFTQSGGFWVTHSEPKFPPSVEDGYSWDSAADKYGQSFLCLSVGLDDIEKVGQAMATNHPHVYDTASPSFAAKVSNFADWTGNEKQASAPETQELKVTAGRTAFTVFAKSTAFGDDLYSGLVAPALGSDLHCETWQDGRGDLSASCKGSDGAKFDVVTVDDVNIGGEKWTVKEDHSKWAVTDDGKTLCVGDINRQSGQFKRGGGTICAAVPLAKTMRKAVVDEQSCSSTREIVV